MTSADDRDDRKVRALGLAVIQRAELVKADDLYGNTRRVLSLVRHLRDFCHLSIFHHSESSLPDACFREAESNGYRKKPR